MNIGVIGAGHLGKIHLKCIQNISNLNLIGFYDIDHKISTEVSSTFNIKSFNSAQELIESCDIIDIVTPTQFHYDLAKKAIKAGKHIFIEKPVTSTIEQAEDLLRLRDKYDVKIQIGHVERFNPAFSSINMDDLNPMFVEVHRLSSFNPRGTDVSVVLDLMIHDIDIILSIIKSPIKSILANGVQVVSNQPDIANARIEFENGCVVNLTASRISMKQMRKMRLFQSDAYISIDFLEKNSQVFRLYDQEPEDGYLTEWSTDKGKKYIQVDLPEILPTNAIKVELESFLDCIVNDTIPKVTLDDGYKALAVAKKISLDINERLKNMSKN